VGDVRALGRAGLGSGGEEVEMRKHPKWMQRIGGIKRMDEGWISDLT